MITSDLYDELTLFLGCEELVGKTFGLDMNTLGIKNILQGCYSYCVENCQENPYIEKIRKNGTLPNYERKNVSFIATNEREKISQVSPIVSNDKSEYVQKLPFPPLSPKEARKKRRRKRERI